MTTDPGAAAVTAPARVQRGYYPAACASCGWTGSSEDAGGLPKPWEDEILHCPDCGMPAEETSVPAAGAQGGGNADRGREGES